MLIYFIFLFYFCCQESPTEQVIMWDIHRTFPAHDYFKSTGGKGQEMLYKISKVSLEFTFFHLLEIIIVKKVVKQIVFRACQ